MPGPGTKDRISVKEAVEVSFISYITWYITWYITLYGWQLGVFPEMDREAPGLFTEISLPASVLYKTSPGRKRSMLSLSRISSKTATPQGDHPF